MDDATSCSARIETLVRETLAAVAPESDLSALHPDRPFRDQIDIDSIDFLNFVKRIEKLLGCRIPETDYPQMTTLSGCVSYLARYYQSAGAEGEGDRCQKR